MGFHPPEIIFLLISVFCLVMLADCIMNKSISGTQKVLWFLLIFFTHIVGAVIYFIIGRSKKNVDYQPSQPASVEQAEQHQPYAQGYQSQQPPSSPSGVQTTPLAEQYDQPSTAYPQQPQQDTR